MITTTPPNHGGSFCLITHPIIITVVIVVIICGHHLLPPPPPPPPSPSRPIELTYRLPGIRARAHHITNRSKQQVLCRPLFDNLQSDGAAVGRVRARSVCNRGVKGAEGQVAGRPASRLRVGVLLNAAPC